MRSGPLDMFLKFELQVDRSPNFGAGGGGVKISPFPLTRHIAYTTGSSCDTPCPEKESVVYSSNDNLDSFVIFAARCYAEHGNATVSRLSVCLFVRLSVTFRYRDHIGWNISKQISRQNSLRYLLTLTPTWSWWAIWSNENTPKIRGIELGSWLMSTKPAISLKRCMIEPRILWRTNRKSHTRFRLYQN